MEKRNIQYELKNEAHMLGKYLIGREIDNQIVSLYSRAIQETNSQLMKTNEKRVWKLIQKWPWALGILDSGLAMMSSTSVIRKRILLMLAILETQPQFSRYFLDKKSKFLDFVELELNLCKAAIETALGIILVKLMGL